MRTVNIVKQTVARSAKIFNNVNLPLVSPIEPRWKGLEGGAGVEHDDFLKRKLCLPIDP